VLVETLRVVGQPRALVRDVVVSDDPVPFGAGGAVVAEQVREQHGRGLALP
jgi:hypothetical protein